MTDLTKERYIVTAYFPESPFRLNEIVTFDPDDACAYSANGKAFSKSLIEKSTANFRRLGWWEHREAKNMPEYLEFPCGRVARCEWVMDNRLRAIDADGDWFERTFIYLRYDMAAPATKNDYEAYRNKKI